MNFVVLLGALLLVTAGELLIRIYVNDSICIPKRFQKLFERQDNFVE